MPYTKARIATRMPDGTYASIFYAGSQSVADVGETLLEYYPAAEHAKALVAGGDLKRLGPSRGDSVSLTARVTGPKRYPSRQALVDAAVNDMWSAWIYLRGHTEWRFRHVLWPHMRPLADYLAEQAAKLGK